MNAGPANSSALLLLELKKFLEASLRNYPLPSPTSADLDQAPAIFLHDMPDDGWTELYPYVLVRWMGRELRSEPDHSTTLVDEVGLVAGVYAPVNQEQAGLLLADTVDRICWSLWRLRLLAGRFELVEPLTVASPAPELKTHLYHLSTITTHWNYHWPPKGLAEMTENGVLR